MKYSKSREVNEIVEKVLDQGWGLKKGNGPHPWHLVPVDKAFRPIPIPGTPSDHRSALNFRARVRQAGGVV